MEKTNLHTARSENFAEIYEKQANSKKNRRETIFRTVNYIVYRFNVPQLFFKTRTRIYLLSRIALLVSLPIKNGI